MPTTKLPLRYHQAVLDMLGIEARPSKEAADELHLVESRDEFTFPESLFEFCALENADKILLGKSENQIPNVRELRRLKWMEYVRGSEVSRGPLYPGEEEEEISAWTKKGYRTVPVTDMLGTISLATDREGISNFAALLDGSADPPVYNLGETTWPHWRLLDPQYSGFVFWFCADTWLRPDDSECIYMEAQSNWPDSGALQRLAGAIKCGPQYCSGPLPRSLWFHNAGAALHLCDPGLAYGCENPAHDAVWTIISGYEEPIDQLRSQVNAALGTRMRFLGL